MARHSIISQLTMGRDFSYTTSSNALEMDDESEMDMDNTHAMTISRQNQIIDENGYNLSTSDLISKIRELTELLPEDKSDSEEAETVDIPEATNDSIYDILEAISVYAWLAGQISGTGYVHFRYY
jgi:hypothetical protein